MQSRRQLYVSFLTSFVVFNLFWHPPLFGKPVNAPSVNSMHYWNIETRTTDQFESPNKKALDWYSGTNYKHMIINVFFRGYSNWVRQYEDRFQFCKIVLTKVCFQQSDWFLAINSFKVFLKNILLQENQNEGTNILMLFLLGMDQLPSHVYWSISIWTQSIMDAYRRCTAEG